MIDVIKTFRLEKNNDDCNLNLQTEEETMKAVIKTFRLKRKMSRL